MDDPDPADTIFRTVVLTLIFLLLTVFLSLADEATDAVGDTRIRELAEEGDRRARRLRRLTENARRFRDRIEMAFRTLTALTVLTLVFGFMMPLSRWIGTVCPWEFLSVLVAVFLPLLLALLLVTAFGQYLPRVLIRKRPEPTVWRLSRYLAVMTAVFAPLDGLCRLLSPKCPETDEVTEEDIRELIDAGEETGSIEGTQIDMVNNVFEFDDITAAEIMTPRTDVIAVEADDPVTEALKAGVENGYSRIPVYEEDIDHIIGLLTVKDLLPYVGREIPPEVTVRRLLRTTHFVPDTKKCDDLFEEMNDKHLQMAIVVDEYGGVAGIVTMEDLLESIVGNMQDEFDHENEEVTQLDDGTFEVDGSLNIGELSELVGTDLPEGDYDTVAGFLMDQLGHIPEKDENPTVTYEGLTLSVLEMDDRRIERVLVKIVPAETPDEADE